MHAVFSTRNKYSQYVVPSICCIQSMAVTMVHAYLRPSIRLTGTKLSLPKKCAILQIIAHSTSETTSTTVGLDWPIWDRSKGQRWILSSVTSPVESFDIRLFTYASTQTICSYMHSLRYIGLRMTECGQRGTDSQYVCLRPPRRQPHLTWLDMTTEDHRPSVSRSERVQ